MIDFKKRQELKNDKTAKTTRALLTLFLQLNYEEEYRPGLRVDLNPDIVIDNWQSEHAYGDGVPLGTILITNWDGMMPALNAEQQRMLLAAFSDTWTRQNSETLQNCLDDTYCPDNASKYYNVDKEPLRCSKVMALAVRIFEEFLEKNRMPEFIKDWKPRTTHPPICALVQPGMVKPYRRHFEQILFLCMDFLDYMIQKYGANTLPIGLVNTGTLTQRKWSLANKEKKANMTKKKFAATGDAMLYKGMLLALFEHDACVLVGFLDQYERMDYGTMRVLLDKWHDLLLYSTNFTQLTEQMLEALKNKMVEATEGVSLILHTEEQVSAASGNQTNAQLYEQF